MDYLKNRYEQQIEMLKQQEEDLQNAIKEKEQIKLLDSNVKEMKKRIKDLKKELKGSFLKFW